MLHETDEELREIKREIIESRGLVIKTNNLTNALSADVKSIAKRQQSYERKLSWNSATAYVVFVFVVFAALKVAWDARVDQIRAETDTRQQENDRLRKGGARGPEARGGPPARRGEGRAVLRVVKNNKRQELVEGYEAIKKEPIGRAEQAIFADAADRAKNELAAQVYTHGLEKLKAKRWQEAASAFEESLRLKDDSSIGPSVRLGLAQAYRGLGRHKDAIPIHGPRRQHRQPRGVRTTPCISWRARRPTSRRGTTRRTPGARCCAASPTRATPRRVIST